MVQDAPTHWVEKLSGLLTVQDAPTHWVEKLSGLLMVQDVLIGLRS